MLHDYLAPEAADSTYQEVARFLHLKRTAHTMGEYLASLDSLPRRAGARTQMGVAFPATFVPIPI